MSKWQETGGKVIGGTVQIVRGLILLGLGGGAALWFLLAVLIRDVPSIQGVATGLVTDLALAINVPPDMAGQAAAQAVARVDSSLLGGALSLADNLRFIIKALPVIFGAIALFVIWTAHRGWDRRRWFGFTAAVFGGALLLDATILRLAANAAVSPLSGHAEDVAHEYIGALIGPASTVGLVGLIGGLAWMVFSQVRLKQVPVG